MIMPHAGREDYFPFTSARRPASPPRNARRYPVVSDECTTSPCLSARRNHNHAREVQGIPRGSPCPTAWRDSAILPDSSSPPTAAGSCLFPDLIQPPALRPPPAIPPCSCRGPDLHPALALFPMPAIRPCSCHVLDLSQPSVFAPDTFSSSRAPHLAAWLFTTMPPDANTSLSFQLRCVVVIAKHPLPFHRPNFGAIS